MHMRTLEIQRITIISARPFQEVLDRIAQVIGRPDMAHFRSEMAAVHTAEQLQQIVDRAIGSSGFMEFARYDLGAVVRLEQAFDTAKSVRIVMGNPLIMREMVKRVADAGSYAPVTILVDEHPDGVRLSYDSMESFLRTYGDDAALEVARELDAKVLQVFRTAAD